MPMNIRVQDATLKRDTELIGKMDPYCVITIGNEVHKTKTHHKGGKNPSWNQLLTFSKSQDVFMVVEVFDKELIVDDLVGHTTVNLKKFLTAPGCLHNESVTIFYKGHNAGTVRLVVEYQSSTAANQAWNYQPYGAQPYNDNSAWGRNTDAPWTPSPQVVANLANLTKPTNQGAPSPYQNILPATQLPSNPYVPANPYVAASPPTSAENKTAASNPTTPPPNTHTTNTTNTANTTKPATNENSDVNYDAIWDTPTEANPYQKS